MSQATEREVKSHLRALEIADEVKAAVVAKFLESVEAELATLPSDMLIAKIGDPIKDMASLSDEEIRSLAARAGFIGSLFAALNLSMFALYFQARHPFLSDAEASDMAEQATLATKSVADAIGYSTVQLFEARASSFAASMGANK